MSSSLGCYREQPPADHSAMLVLGALWCGGSPFDPQHPRSITAPATGQFREITHPKSEHVGEGKSHGEGDQSKAARCCHCAMGLRGPRAEGDICRCLFFPSLKCISPRSSRVGGMPTNGG